MKNLLQIVALSIGILLGQTGEQIKQAKTLIKQSGMSEKQARDLAKKQGYSDKQINDAIETKKVASSVSEEKYSENSNNIVDQEALSESRSDDSVGELSLDQIDESQTLNETDLDIAKEKQPGKSDLTYFGYDIFSQDPKLFQGASVGIVDPDYLIGPGDEIIVMLWGETQFRQVLPVDREGFVFIPEIGQVFVNGLNLNLLESKLFKVFSQSYASLNPQGRTPTTFLDISLGNLRPLRIQVLGEVAQPGAYTVSPSATLFSSLYYFNGPTKIGSLREIQLIRGGEKIATIDFYDYLLTGKKPEDRKLQLDDVIFIPRRLKTVSIEGEVNRSGIYELKPDEDLKDLINMAGELKISAYLDRSQIDRIVPFENRKELGMDRLFTDVDLGQLFKSRDEFPLKDGDQVQVFSILDIRQNVVELRGAVTRPGNYDLGKSLKIDELITKADGLLGDAYMERIDIVRTKTDFTEELIKLDLSKAIDKDPKNNISLQGLDKVRVYGISEMVPKKYVRISGNVKFPGRFPLQGNMTLYDLIFSAGGYMDEEFKKGTHMDRAELIRVRDNTFEKEIIPFALNEVLDKQGVADMLLLPDDVIRIYSHADIEGGALYVSINGHVKRPGRYELFEKNMRIHDLLFMAGGFDDPLFRSQTFLDRADLIRYDSDQIARSIISFNLKSVLSEKDNEQNIILLPGDEIRVYSQEVFNNIKNVSINGVVRNPGIYELKNQMTVKDLILEAGGLEDNVYKYKTEIARIDPFKNNFDKYAEIISFNIDGRFKISNSTYNNISESKNSNLENDFILKPYDIVSIRPDPYFNYQKQINISGEVLYPGNYTILSPNEKVTDIIKRAGGLKPNAYPEGSHYFRKGVKINASFSKIIKNPRSKNNFIVQDKDSLNIVSSPNLILVNGEVNRDGVHKYVSGKRLRYYLKLAGGVRPDADLDNIWVEFPNGDSKQFKKWSIFSPKVIDGSIIVVGKKKEEEPFNHTEYAKEVTAILANLAQTLAVVALAVNR